MKILVTGGAGFIGSQIVDEYIKRGKEVVVIDNLTKGKKENINRKAKFYKVDLREDKQLLKVFEKEKPEVVNHQAAQVEIGVSLVKPVFDADNNIRATINLLEGCKKFKIKRIIYASSCAIYGMPKKLPCTEKSKIEPIGPYGLSKYCCEEYIKLYNRLYGIDYNILRYGNVFGPRQEEGGGGVVSIFINKALNSKPCVILGDGKQTRDFVYVKDVVKANLRALAETKSKIFNIANEKEISVNDVFKEIKKYFPKVSKIYQETIKKEPRRIRLSVAKAKKELRWEPRYDFKEGLKETIFYFKNLF